MTAFSKACRGILPRSVENRLAGVSRRAETILGGTMWIKRQVLCLLLSLSFLSPVLPLEQYSETPTVKLLTLDEVFNQFDLELGVLRLQSENETRRFKILEKQTHSDQLIINSLQTQSTKDKESLTKLEESQKKDKDRLAGLQTLLKEAEKSIRDEAIRMQAEKVKAGIIGTAAGIGIGAAVVGITWYFTTR